MIFHLTSKRPVFIAGSGVRSAGAQHLLLEFASKTDIPVVTTMNAVDLIQDEMKLGFIGVYGNRTANRIVSECDLAIAVGARLGLRQIGNRPDFFAPHAKLIRAEIDPDELSRNVKPEEEKYLMDAKEFLVRLLEEPIPKYTAWKDICYGVKQCLADKDKEAGNKCIEKISSLLPSNPIVAIDVGQNQCWSAQSFTLKGTAGRLLIGGGYGSMGCALPYAIGASIAADNGTVFCITGDGGFQMNLQEIQVIVREKLPVKILILNNRVLGKISEVQTVNGISYAQTTKDSGYTVPDFGKVAEAYGIRAATLSSYEELDFYKEWLYDSASCLLNILLPEDSRLIPKINWNSNEILPELDRETENRILEILG